MKPIIEISGKAKNVFKYLEVLNQHSGNTTIGKLAKNHKSIKIELK